MRARGALKLLLKAALGGAIFAYLLSKTPLEGLWDSILRADPRFYAGALLLYLAGQVLSAYKWGLLAEPLGFRRSFKDLVAFYFIGMYFNLFMIGSIGGDIYRAGLLAGREQSRMRAAYSIFAERFTGGMALITFASLALLSSFREVLPQALKVGVLVSCFVVWGVVIAMPKLVEVFPWMERLASKVKLGDFTVYWSSPGRLLAVILVSFLFQAMNILTVALLGMGLGMKVAVGAYFFVVPVVDLVSVLPVSISGLGVREGSYVFLFHLLGAETARGFACSLLVLSVVVLSGLIGAVVYFFTDYPVVIRRRR